MSGDRLLNAAEVAEILGTSAQALAHMRARGTGPQFVRIGRRVKYRQSDVDLFIEEVSR